MGNGNQIAVRDADIVATIDKWAPDHFSYFHTGSSRQFEAWKQDAALAVIENTQLKSLVSSEEGRVSLVRALQRSAASGLSLNPQKGESALVPIGGKINFWPMKNGIIKKALETGALEFIEANTIYVGDTFNIKKTARGDDYDFTPSLEDRGESYAYFAVAVLKSGRSVVEYWTKSQIESHAKKFGKGANNSTSAWNTNFDGMAEKTVLKALLAGLHLPKVVSELIEADNEAEQSETRNITEPTAKGTSAEGLIEDIKSQKEEQEHPNNKHKPLDDTLF
jgi:recombination protein RecT